jgi:hypothetical protein
MSKTINFSLSVIDVFTGFRSSQIPVFSDSGLLRFWSSQIPVFSDSGLLKFRYSQIPVFSNSGILRFRSSQIPVFSGSGLLRFRSSQVPVFSGSGLLRLDAVFWGTLPGLSKSRVIFTFMVSRIIQNSSHEDQEESCPTEKPHIQHVRIPRYHCSEELKTHT